MKKILIADDEELIRGLATSTLGTEHYQLFEASDGIDALSVARSEHPDLILLDIRMPGMNGLEVCRELKADPSTAGIKVIILTAYVRDEDVKAGREAGADSYFAKPFSPTELTSKIEEILDSE